MTLNTIAQAYRAWVAIEAKRNAAEGLDDKRADRLTDALMALEEAAIQQPASTATDVRMLLSMASSDILGGGAFSNAICLRARKEAHAAAVSSEVRA